MGLAEASGTGAKRTLEGAAGSAAAINSAEVKALARAFRWRKLLDGGVCATIEELARREKVNRGYMSRVLRLTLLAPDIVEAILDGRQPDGLRLEDLLNGFSADWRRQRASLGAQGRDEPWTEAGA